MKIRKQLGSYVRKKLGITESRQSLQRQVNFLSALVGLNLPEILHPGEEINRKVDRALQEEFGEMDFFRGIHRNDIMFQHHLYHAATDPAEAFVSYCQVGARAARQLAQLCEKHRLQPQKMLDFGSGYGRVSRFLPHFLPNTEILVSEVKPLALAFQKKNFDFKAVHHSETASSFPHRGFDLIFALSVFTHLPEESFKEWFETLANCLNPGGILVFSFNNLERISAANNGRIYFTGQSEDSSFIVSDRLADQEKYGLTFVSKEFLSGLADQGNASLDFYGSLFSGKQEVGVFRAET